MHGVACLIIQQCIRSQFGTTHFFGPLLDARHELLSMP
jgi:hypothetical protein